MNGAALHLCLLFWQVGSGRHHSTPIWHPVPPLSEGSPVHLWCPQKPRATQPMALTLLCFSLRRKNSIQSRVGRWGWLRGGGTGKGGNERPTVRAGLRSQSFCPTVGATLVLTREQRRLGVQFCSGGPHLRRNTWDLPGRTAEGKDAPLQMDGGRVWGTAGTHPPVEGSLSPCLGAPTPRPLLPGPVGSGGTQHSRGHTCSRTRVWPTPLRT